MEISENWAALVAILVITGLVIGSQTKAVGHRWADTSMALIPFYGLFFFVPKMLWRMAALPQTPWDGSRANDHVWAHTGPPGPAQMPAFLPPPPPPLRHCSTFGSNAADRNDPEGQATSWRVAVVSYDHEGTSSYLRRNGWAMKAAIAPDATMRYPERLRTSW
jgi:hypothetical protein